MVRVVAGCCPAGRFLLQVRNCQLPRTHLSGWTLVAPGGWNTPDFLFTYGAGILFAAIYLGAKIWEVSFRNKAFIVYKKADQLDFATDLPEIEAMTVAYEEERELKRRNGSGLWHKIDRVLF